MTLTLLLSIVISFCLVMPAHAYFDPGTGALLAQVLIGVLAVVSLFFRRILNLAGKLFGKNDESKNDKS